MYLPWQLASLFKNSLICLETLDISGADSFEPGCSDKMNDMPLVFANSGTSKPIGLTTAITVACPSWITGRIINRLYIKRGWDLRASRMTKFISPLKSWGKKSRGNMLTSSYSTCAFILTRQYYKRGKTRTNHLNKKLGPTHHPDSRFKIDPLILLCGNNDMTSLFVMVPLQHATIRVMKISSGTTRCMSRERFNSFKCRDALGMMEPSVTNGILITGAWCSIRRLRSMPRL